MLSTRLQGRGGAPCCAVLCCAAQVGELRKAEVRALAAERGLLPAKRRSSAGICFIGRQGRFCRAEYAAEQKPR